MFDDQLGSEFDELLDNLPLHTRNKVLAALPPPAHPGRWPPPLQSPPPHLSTLQHPPVRSVPGPVVVLLWCLAIPFIAVTTVLGMVSLFVFPPLGLVFMMLSGSTSLGMGKLTRDAVLARKMRK